MSSVTEAVTRYGAIAVGLLLGTAAKYGVAITEGQTPKWATVLADILMLGLLGLIAVISADWLALKDQNLRMFAGAIAALLSARLIKMIRDKALRRADVEMDNLLGRKAGTSEALRQSYAPTTPPPAEITETLAKLD